ncbi:MAG TPA: hypothetical protein VKU00_12940 [Chthonomonadaceae bacterium]|nr:hypothetical protein [Chthonomonadaceae bacterium]
MVDRAARDAYAQLLRHFASGVITNDEYDDRFFQIHDDTSDPALWCIWEAVWPCYCDLRTYRLRGKHTLSPETRRVIARAIHCANIITTQSPGVEICLLMSALFT